MFTAYSLREDTGSATFEEESSSLILLIFGWHFIATTTQGIAAGALQLSSDFGIGTQIYYYNIFYIVVDIGNWVNGHPGACDTRGAYGRSRRLASSVAAGPRRDFGVAQAIILLYRCYATKKCVHAHYTILLLLLYLVGCGPNVCQTRTYPHTRVFIYIYIYYKVSILYILCVCRFFLFLSRAPFPLPSHSFRGRLTQLLPDVTIHYRYILL